MKKQDLKNNLRFLFIILPIAIFISLNLGELIATLIINFNLMPYIIAFIDFIIIG